MLTEGDCRQMLERLSGGSLPFDSRLLKPSTPRQILVRMLNNLRGIYLNRSEPLRVIDPIAEDVASMIVVVAALAGDE